MYLSVDGAAIGASSFVTQCGQEKVPLSVAMWAVDSSYPHIRARAKVGIARAVVKRLRDATASDQLNSRVACGSAT